MVEHAQKSLDDFLREGVLISNSVSACDIQSLVDRCRPRRAQLELIRLGGCNDGGYLVPDDLDGISACFSPGVSDSATFELELLQKHGIPSHMADYSVNAPPVYARQKSFLKRYLGAYSSDVYISLDDWVQQFESGGDSFDLLLQMDIEGSEYEAILGSSIEILRRFRILVIEFHEFQNIGHPSFFKLVRATFNKLFEGFLPLHIHPNNCCHIRNVNGVLIPPVFEMTLIRKDRCVVSGYQNMFPHPLDRPNLSDRPDLALPLNWQGL
jgi:hypothetical protein